MECSICLKRLNQRFNVKFEDVKEEHPGQGGSLTNPKLNQVDQWTEIKEPGFDFPKNL